MTLVVTRDSKEVDRRWGLEALEVLELSGPMQGEAHIRVCPPHSMTTTFTSGIYSRLQLRHKAVKLAGIHQEQEGLIYCSDAIIVDSVEERGSYSQ